eukprot:2033689-Prymnesium_polylepis.1
MPAGRGWGASQDIPGIAASGTHTHPIHAMAAGVVDLRCAMALPFDNHTCARMWGANLDHRPE